MGKHDGRALYYGGKQHSKRTLWCIMGIVNMMIVIPMILQNLSFRYVYEYVLAGNPNNAIIFAGVLLGLAALATLRIKVTKVNDENIVMPMGGAH